MKKLLFAVFCLAVFAGCKQEKPQADPAVVQERDSLNKVIEQKENEINDMMTTMNAFFLSYSVRSSSNATGMQPFLKNTFSGVRNHSMFSLLSATVLILIRCLTPTFSETELQIGRAHV